MDPKETTDDAFLGGALRILQPKAGFRAGMDSLLLAASIDGRGHVLDVGAGVGVVGLALARRVAEAEVVLVERDPHLLELARANIARNGLVGTCRCQLVRSVVRNSVALSIVRVRRTRSRVFLDPN